MFVRAGLLNSTSQRHGRGNHLVLILFSYGFDEENCCHDKLQNESSQAVDGQGLYFHAFEKEHAGGEAQSSKMGCAEMNKRCDSRLRTKHVGLKARL